MTAISMKSKKFIGVVLGAALLLIWMEFAVGFISQEEDLVTKLSLTLLPFIIIGAITTFIDTIIAFRRTSARSTAYRLGVGVALAAAFILCWAIPAVGFIAADGNPADLVYFGVITVGIIGALIARFEAQGMARALFATALAQAAAPVIAMMIWKPQFSQGVFGVIALNGFFIALFVGSALLFRRAAH